MASSRDLLKLLDKVPMPTGYQKLKNRLAKIGGEQQDVINKACEEKAKSFSGLWVATAHSLRNSIQVVVNPPKNDKTARHCSYKPSLLAYKITAWARLEIEANGIKEAIQSLETDHAHNIGEIRKNIMLHGGTPENVKAVEALVK